MDTLCVLGLGGVRLPVLSLFAAKAAYPQLLKEPGEPMGLLRVYLALCVVIVHSSDTVTPWAVHNGREAVQIFYIISGFYMALIFQKYDSPLEFYASRFLRIFVPYWITLGLVFLISFLAGLVYGRWLELEPYVLYSAERNGRLGVVIAAISNLTLFFQDWVLFLKHDPGQALTFSVNFRESRIPLYAYLFIPQAWTLGLELTFYLFVPFLAKAKTRVLVATLVLSLFLRIWTYEVLHIRNDPWDYRFFPFELALFVLGMLSFRAYAYSALPFLSFQIKTTKQYILGAFFLCGFFFAAKALVPFLTGMAGRSYGELLSYAGWAVVIPFLFQIFGKSQQDRLVGDLSYPNLYYPSFYYFAGAASVRRIRAAEHSARRTQCVIHRSVYSGFLSLYPFAARAKKIRLCGGNGARDVAAWPRGRSRNCGRLVL